MAKTFRTTKRCSYLRTIVDEATGDKEMLLTDQIKIRRLNEEFDNGKFHIEQTEYTKKYLAQ